MFRYASNIPRKSWKTTFPGFEADIFILNTENPFTIAYDVYDTPVNADTVNNYEAINTTAEPGEYGYHLCTFLYGSDSKTQPVTLALNQNALYGQTLSDIAGDYSGTITFHSALFERS